MAMGAARPLHTLAASHLISVPVAPRVRLRLLGPLRVSARGWMGTKA